MITFAAIGLNHGHIYGICQQLIQAGATLSWFYAAEPDLIAEFQRRYPDARLARSEQEILDDPHVQLITSASIPDLRAPLGIRAMHHGKDYIADKPGFTSLSQVAEARRIQAETRRIYSVYFSERFDNRATLKAGELVNNGAIGQVIQTVGFGPHRVGTGRPDWFWQRSRYGGIINDLASHQVDQFLYFTRSTLAEIASAHIGNFHHPDRPEFDDFGDLSLRSLHATGYARVDWLTPAGLGTWGDTRLTILGTEGYIELRKNCDIGGRSGGNHLFLVDGRGVQYMDCASAPLTYGAQIIGDVLNRTEQAMPQAHCLLASELTLQAEQRAARLIRPG